MEDIPAYSHPQIHVKRVMDIYFFAFIVGSTFMCCGLFGRGGVSI